MSELTDKLQKLGWKIGVFQPKGEVNPWALHIHRTLSTGTELVIEAYLDPNNKLTDKEKDKRILSTLRAEQVKNSDIIEKGKYLSEFAELTGPVHIQKISKTVRSAKVKNENDLALEKIKSTPEPVNEEKKDVAKPATKKRGRKPKAITTTEPDEAKNNAKKTTKKTDEPEEKTAIKKTTRERKRKKK